MSVHSVTIDLTVDNESSLFRAAFDCAVASGNSLDGAAELLRYEDGRINVSNCLLMLLDPGQLEGCAILGSSAEQVEPSRNWLVARS